MPIEGDAKPVIRLDVGIFAHNEEERIAALIGDLAHQDIFSDEDVDVRLWVLANGCRDSTVAQVQTALDAQAQTFTERVQVLNFTQGGKSRTMHRYIHETSRENISFLGFMDADIRLPEPGTLSSMVTALQTRPILQAFVSRPVKDVDHEGLNVGFSARLIAAGGGGLNDFRKAICGQLFMLRADMARSIALPTGLPVEDGFIRAMVVTDMLREPEDLERIDGEEGIFHTYESIRTIPELLQHQTRIVVGSAVNSALFSRIRDAADQGTNAEDLLHGAVTDPDWLGRVLDEELPRRPFGYVPFHFLIGRLTEGRFGLAMRRGPKGWAMLIAGVALDALVYIRATARMMAGRAAGHW